MLQQLLRGLYLLHALLFCLAAVGFFAFWARTRFWLPKYVHVLAAAALIIGVWCADSSPADTPLGKAGPIAKLLAAFVLPVIVYFFFVFYGGQRTAFRRRFRKTVPCPTCGLSVLVFETGSDSSGSAVSNTIRCRNCGQSLASHNWAHPPGL
jgi:peptidoglycan/LPS O-acetylase OafA/YrhL